MEFVFSICSHRWSLLRYSFVCFKNLPATLNSSSIICLHKLSSLSPFHRIMSTWKSKIYTYGWQNKLFLFNAPLDAIFLFHSSVCFFFIMRARLSIFCESELANVHFCAGPVRNACQQSQSGSNNNNIVFLFLSEHLFLDLLVNKFYETLSFCHLYIEKRETNIQKKDDTQHEDEIVEYLYWTTPHIICKHFDNNESNRIGIFHKMWMVD